VSKKEADTIFYRAPFDAKSRWKPR